MSTQVEHAKPATDAVCSVCSAPMPPGASKCEQCGATHGQQHRCPFCKTVAEPQPHPRLRFACPACGAPRVLLRDKQLEVSDAVASHLGKARSADSSMVTWQLGGAVAVGFGVLAVLLLTGIAMVAGPPTLALGMAALVTSMPFIFGVLGWAKAAARKAELHSELDDAWLEAARMLARKRESVTAGALTEAFGLDEQEARRLATRLAASSEVTTDVTDSGDLALSIRVPDKLRIDTGEPAPSPRSDADEVVEEPAEPDAARRGKAGT